MQKNIRTHLKGKMETCLQLKNNWCNSGAHTSRVSPLFTCVALSSAWKNRPGYL